MSGAIAASALGFFGKLPARGDFVRSGLPGSFVRPWDDWLQAALPASRAVLGGCWSESWRVAPFWRLSLPAGVCGPDPVVGVVCPSVDGVGREFPLLLAACGWPGGGGAGEVAATLVVEALAAIPIGLEPAPLLAAVCAAIDAAHAATQNEAMSRGGLVANTVVVLATRPAFGPASGRGIAAPTCYATARCAKSPATIRGCRNWWTLGPCRPRPPRVMLMRTW